PSPSPFLPSSLIATPCALLSSLVAHNSLPVLVSNARNRLSLVAPMNKRPPAVTIGPPRFNRPVFCFPAGSSSVLPRRTFHAISPVAASTATRLPHGGF